MIGLFTCRGLLLSVCCLTNTFAYSTQSNRIIDIDKLIHISK
jgi:hypothetical protein